MQQSWELIVRFSRGSFVSDVKRHDFTYAITRTHKYNSILDRWPAPGATLSKKHLCDSQLYLAQFKNYNLVFSGLSGDSDSGTKLPEWIQAK